MSLHGHLHFFAFSLHHTHLRLAFDKHAAGTATRKLPRMQGKSWWCWQVINRDLSVAILNFFCTKRREEVATGKLRKLSARKQASDGPSPSPATAPHASGIRVLEGLAASGLRSIRYALEVLGISIKEH